jgi:hypothetical protein
MKNQSQTYRSRSGTAFLATRRRFQGSLSLSLNCRRCRNVRSQSLKIKLSDVCLYLPNAHVHHIDGSIPHRLTILESWVHPIDFRLWVAFWDQGVGADVFVVFCKKPTDSSWRRETLDPPIEGMKSTCGQDVSVGARWGAF